MRVWPMTFGRPAFDGRRGRAGGIGAGRWGGDFDLPRQTATRSRVRLHATLGTAGGTK